MKSYKTKDGNHSISIHNNGGSFLTIASQYGEYWFTVGTYKTEATALRHAKKSLARFGYEIAE